MEIDIAMWKSFLPLEWLETYRFSWYLLLGDSNSVKVIDSDRLVDYPLKENLGIRAGLCEENPIFFNVSKDLYDSKILFNRHLSDSFTLFCQDLLSRFHIKFVKIQNRIQLRSGFSPMASKVYISKNQSHNLFIRFGNQNATVNFRKKYLETEEQFQNRILSRVSRLESLNNLPCRRIYEERKMSVLLCPKPASFLVHEALGHNFESLNELRDRLFCSQLEIKKDCFSQQISLYDDGIMLDGSANIGFDDYGNECRSTPLIEQGRVVGLLGNGNFRSESVRQKPSVRMTNTSLVSHWHLPLEKLKEKADLIIEDYIVRGDSFSEGNFELEFATGWHLLNGRPVAQTGPVILRGNLFEALNIDFIGTAKDNLMETLAPAVCGKNGQNIQVDGAAPYTLVRLFVKSVNLN